MSNMEYICDTCKKAFKNKKTLNVHIKSAKFCRRLRQDEGENYKCRCGKIFTYQLSYQRHQEKCKMDTEDKKRLTDLQKQYDNIKEKLYETGCEMKHFKTCYENEQKLNEEFNKRIKLLEQDLVRERASNNTYIDPTATDFNEEFEEKCLDTFDRLESCYSLKEIARFFTAMTVNNGFNYVSKDISRDTYAFYIGGEYHTDNGGYRILSLIKLFVLKTYKKIDCSDLNVEDRTEKTSLLCKIKDKTIFKALKVLPSFQSLKNIAYRNDYLSRYSFDKFDIEEEELDYIEENDN